MLHARVLARPLIVLQRVAIVALLAALAVGGAALFARVVHECRGPYTADSTLYLAIGRGILNRLVPYRDLYESKPPGIFVLSALSLWLTGSARVANVAQGLVAAGLVLIPGWHILRRLGHIGGLRLLVGLAAVFLLGLYAAMRSGEFQVEIFGVFFCVLYLLVISQHRQTAATTLLAGVCLALAAGFKEPFALTALAGCLVIVPAPSALVRRFVAPALVAAALGLVTLVACGWARAYFSIYLSEMLGQHVVRLGSPWARGLHLERLFFDLRAFCTPLGLVTGAIFALSQIWRYRRAEDATQKRFVVLSAAVAVYLAGVAVGLGGEYYDHHFDFAVPLYFAGVISFVDANEVRASAPALCFVGLLAAVSFALLPEPHYAERLANLRRWEENAKSTAAVIDGVLDRCDLERYLFIGANGTQPYAYTRHSPLGPIFFQLPEFIDTNHPRFRNAFAQQINSARFVVLNATLAEDAAMVGGQLQSNFTRTPWSCAGRVERADGYTFYFRK